MGVQLVVWKSQNTILLCCFTSSLVGLGYGPSILYSCAVL